MNWPGRLPSFALTPIFFLLQFAHEPCFRIRAAFPLASGAKGPVRRLFRLEDKGAFPSLREKMVCVGRAVVGVREGEDPMLQDVAAVAADVMVDMEELVSFLARGE